MTGFEPRTCGIGIDRSTNWATATAMELQLSTLVVEEGKGTVTALTVRCTVYVGKLTTFCLHFYAK